jgi:hypothetical protein
MLLEDNYFCVQDAFSHLCAKGVFEGEDGRACWSESYSLVGKAEHWYTYTVGSVNGSWDKLKDKFCCEFYPPPRLATRQDNISCF